jgi:hypothetical protein
MATPIQNRLNGHVWFKAVNANSTISLANMSTNTSLENVTAAAITKIFWSGNWTIKRGSNTVVTLGANNGGVWDLRGNGVALSEYPGATIVLETTDETASIIIEVAKQSYANGSIS